MEVVNSVIDDATGAFKGIFSGGGFSEMSGGKKALVIIVAIIIVVIVVWLLWTVIKKMGGKGFSPRNSGAAGCCGKMQPQRNQVLETMVSQQDIDEENARYAAAGMAKISTQYDPNTMMGFDNYNYTQGFSSPAAKPTANQDSSVADNWNGNKPMVQQQVPNSYNMKPSYEESDYINMAYNG